MVEGATAMLLLRGSQQVASVGQQPARLPGGSQQVANGTLLGQQPAQHCHFGSEETPAVRKS